MRPSSCAIPCGREQPFSTTSRKERLPMAERFRREDEPDSGAGAHSATSTMTEHDERTTVREPDHHRGGEGTVAAGTMAAVRERQRDEFGGFAWGSTFFGWLSAMGLA